MWNLTEFVYLGRLVLAVFCGLIIGYERKSRAKEAGIRTHCVVACASALMMVLSKYAYTDVMEMYGDLMKIDPSRIASGVVSGIGFLGAGMIFVHEKTVTGLTTAAGIWATSRIGMAIGAGHVYIGNLRSAHHCFYTDDFTSASETHSQKTENREGTDAIGYQGV